MASTPLKTVTLECGTEQDAFVVARNADRPTDPDHRVVQAGTGVVITYRRAAFARDVADYAWNAGRASDRAVADLKARL